MLSYQHGYHAGNMADVHKHALLAVMLDYLARKEKPLTYMETHSGRGLYRLDGPEAAKTGEAAQGIAVAERLGWFPADHPYPRRLAEVRERFGRASYPGSPLIAALSLRRYDVMTLAELHPQEFAALEETMAPFRATVLRQDGMEMALSRTPPEPRRGMLLIDPSYEVKEDYAALPRFIGSIARKWNVGVVALWYPLLSGDPHREMMADLTRAHPDALRHEVRFPPARQGHRMVGSGMFILNPPWGTEDEARRLTGLFRSLK